MGTSPYNFLLIEKISSGIKEALELRNHRVSLVTGSRQALRVLDVLENQDFSAIILDLELEGNSGWEVLNKYAITVSNRNIPVLVHTAIDDEQTQIQSLNSGADDFISKPCSINLLLARVEANLRKKKATELIGVELPFENDTYENLSRRELEILKYIIKGYSNKEIAERAYITTLTAANHVKRIFRKLRVNSRTQAVMFAIKNNLVHLMNN